MGGWYEYTSIPYRWVWTPFKTRRKRARQLLPLLCRNRGHNKRYSPYRLSGARRWYWISHGHGELPHAAVWLQRAQAQVPCQQASGSAVYGAVIYQYISKKERSILNLISLSFFLSFCLPMHLCQICTMFYI